MGRRPLNGETFNQHSDQRGTKPEHDQDATQLEAFVAGHGRWAATNDCHAARSFVSVNVYVADVLEL